MHDTQDPPLNDCIWFHEGGLVSEHYFEMGRADLRGGLMEIRLGLSQIHIFRCSNNADGDVAADCVEEEGVEQLAILHEEVQVQPEGVSQHNFGEFAYSIAGLRCDGGPLGLSDDFVARYQSSEQFEVVVVGAFLALLLEGEVLVEHETHEFVLPVADYDHVDLLGYYLVLHQLQYIPTHTYSAIEASQLCSHFILFGSLDLVCPCEAQHQDILYLMQKVSAKDEERFNKAVQIYSKKYRLNISSLIKFIEEKIAVSPQTKNIILAEIVSSKNPEESMSKEQLKMYLHLVAAAQAKVDIRGKKLESFHQFYRLTFKESKPKEEGKAVSDTKGQRKEELAEKKKEEEKIDQQLKKEKAREQPPQNNPQPPHKSGISRSSISSPVKQKLQVIEQDVVDQNRTSNVGFRTQNTQQLLLKMPDAQMMSLQSEKSVRITGYDKFGQNYLNPIIKYHITFGEHSVYRRYSEFQRLMNDLSRRYEGFILPELPPKEGIKSNLSYFWGVDEAFLNDRQVKLEEMLNILLSSKFVSKDDILEKFLKEQDFQIEASSQGGLISYLKPITTIALNTKQLKNYGMAYYNYLKEFNRAEINTSVTVKYKEVQPLLNACLAIDHYRNVINSNFDKRRDVFKELKMDQNDRNLTISKFDKLSSSSASQIKNLSKEIEKYLELKSQESWLNYLIREKESQSEGDVDELRGSKEEIVARISTMEGNLLTSIEELRKEKVAYLEGVGDKMIEWRKAIHP